MLYSFLNQVCNYNTTTLNPQGCELSVSYPMSSTWYYIAVTSNCSYNILVDSQLSCFTSNGASYALVSQQCTKLSPPIDTFRFIGPTYFSVKYYFNSNNNRSNSILVQSSDKPYFIEFLVDLSNNGGTLNFKLINNLVRDSSFNSYDNNINLTNGSAMYDYDLSNVNVVLKVCLLFNSMANYKNCPGGYELSTRSFPNQYSNLAMSVPYPMMGKWYLTMWKECYDATTE